MPYEAIVPPGSRSFAPYSPATKAGNVLYVSGTVALDKDGKLVGAGDIKAQTRFVLESISSLLEHAGGSLQDVAFAQVFLKDVKDFKAMNQVYREFFPSNPPARYCIRADLVAPELLVEIVATAHLPDARA
ncbi:MAG: pyrimidine utilization protein C [Betaproteobacteria bacterium]|nr:MAG: pyrimidine utilization protein C [Betaproteobacteria bacterium]